MRTDRRDADELNARTEVIVEASPVASTAAALQPYVDAWRAQAVRALDYAVLHAALPARRAAHAAQLRALHDEHEGARGRAGLAGHQAGVLEREKVAETKRVVEQMMGVRAFNERIIEMLNGDTARTGLPGP